LRLRFDVDKDTKSRKSGFFILSFGGGGGSGGGGVTEAAAQTQDFPLNEKKTKN
jgi:hypothetical protein